jgi:hypothetical protein
MRRNAKPTKKQLPLSDSVYLPKRATAGYEKVPACIYFYYLYMSGGSYSTRHYYYTDGRNQPIHHSSVKAIVAQLAANAARDGNSPPKYGVDGRYVVWSRISYIAFVVDENRVQWDGDAITIDPVLGLPNHSFYDGTDTTVTVNGASRPAAWCVNYMKDAVGADLGDADEKYQFHLQIGAGARILRPMFPDSGGTNMGPPVPPP